MSLAIFDLDNTLLNGDSDHAWGEFMVRHNQVVRTFSHGFFYQFLLRGFMAAVAGQLKTRIIPAVLEPSGRIA